MGETIDIRRKGTPSFVHLSFLARWGDLYASLHRDSGYLEITNFNVDPFHRRQGIGKGLLLAAVNESRALSVTHYGATILSHACFDVVRTVFGDDALHVLHVTEYDDIALDNSEHDGTRAALIHEVGGFALSEERRQELIEKLLYFGMPKPHPATIETI